jgi:hypothetical protein
MNKYSLLFNKVNLFYKKANKSLHNLYSKAEIQKVEDLTVEDQTVEDQEGYDLGMLEAKNAFKPSDDSKTLQVKYDKLISGIKNKKDSPYSKSYLQGYLTALVQYVKDTAVQRLERLYGDIEGTDIDKLKDLNIQLEIDEPHAMAAQMKIDKIYWNEYIGKLKEKIKSLEAKI